MLHGWLFPTFGQEERKAHQKFPLLAIFGASGLDPPAGEAPQWRTRRNIHLDMNPWDFVECSPGRGRAARRCR